MAKPAEKQRKPGRNDPCPCGSGRKYKDCHLPLEQAARSEQLLLREAQDTLLPKIIEAARSVPESFPAAFARFWQGKYAVEQMPELDQLEDRGAERFLTWFAFDARDEDGQTLVERLAGQEDFTSNPYERRLLDAWRAVRLGAYVVEEVKKGQGLTLRDLLTGERRALADYHASKRLATGEVIVGHLVPADTAPGAAAPTYYLAGAAAQLTEDTAAKLLEFAELHLADLRRANPQATWADLLAERSEALNHFVMALPTEERDPTILDRLISDGRIALQLTAESVAALLGRPVAEASDEERR
ncbi:MAG: SEC-C domain-containing protein [Oscillochloridaceae bacterium]|nr:SEC-C domain-containing protein [Chloroflexaceae bacterium]MDW8392233.1 SEC-C domain-containing protein [Oscillochloridaceae bacterium]